MLIFLHRFTTKGKLFFPSLTNCMGSGPIVAIVWQGFDAIKSQVQVNDYGQNVQTLIFEYFSAMKETRLQILSSMVLASFTSNLGSTEPRK